MPLKDLVADKSKLNEEAIEEIVGQYIRYDPAAYEIVFTPLVNSLNTEQKILVYLTAVMGWRYVVDEVKPVQCNPSALERDLGIAGNTLRPILKKLKDGHLVNTDDQGYAVRVANLEAIKDVVNGTKSAPAQRAKKPKAKIQDATKSDIEKVAGKQRKGVPVRPTLTKLIQEGWFDESRTLTDIMERCGELALIVKATSLSGPIAEFVRNGQLVRKKVVSGKREVWGYTANT